MDSKKCPLCDRDLTPQGFGGHMWGVHGIRTGEHAKLADVNKRVARLEETVPGSVAKLQEATAARITTLESQVGQLISMHKPAKLQEGKHLTQLNP